MARRIAGSYTEHRRGLVLGLTMAEVLILLLFVILLALGHLIQSAREESEVNRLNAERANSALGALKKMIDERVPGEVDWEGVLARLTSLGTEDDPTALREKLRERESELAAWNTLAQAAQGVRPDDPPAATLRAGLSILSGKARDSAEARSAMLGELEDRAREIDAAADPTKTIRWALATAKGASDLPAVWVALRDNERKLAARLRKEFEKDLERWNAALDDSELTLRFQDPELLFEQGSAKLRPSFQEVLRDFFPRYLEVLMEFRDSIDEVRIEGHTSSEWRSESDPMERYFSNMSLSQDRTRSVLRFGMTETAISDEARAWAQGRVTANGLASSRLWLRADGTEDPDRSRRVEFRVLLKLREQLLAKSPG
jgi:outer membrane protein OmpA-like peptidoglycan-associated protein